MDDLTFLKDALNDTSRNERILAQNAQVFQEFSKTTVDAFCKEISKNEERKMLVEGIIDFFFTKIPHIHSLAFALFSTEMAKTKIVSMIDYLEKSFENLDFCGKNPSTLKKINKMEVLILIKLLRLKYQPQTPYPKIFDRIDKYILEIAKTKMFSEASEKSFEYSEKYIFHIILYLFEKDIPDFIKDMNEKYELEPLPELTRNKRERKFSIHFKKETSCQTDLCDLPLKQKEGFINTPKNEFKPTRFLDKRLEKLLSSSNKISPTFSFNKLEDVYSGGSSPNSIPGIENHKSTGAMFESSTQIRKKHRLRTSFGGKIALIKKKKENEDFANCIHFESHLDKLLKKRRPLENIKESEERTASTGSENPYLHCSTQLPKTQNCIINESLKERKIPIIEVFETPKKEENLTKTEAVSVKRNLNALFENLPSFFS